MVDHKESLPAASGINQAVIDWLMAGDPAIRWQTIRDLQGTPKKEWHAEQRRTLTEGWGARLLALQASDGSWGGGIYSPKWTSTTYTVLMLCALGIPPGHAPAQRGAALVLDTLLGPKRDDAFLLSLARCDRCIVGMILQIAAYFGIGDARLDAIVENLLVEIMPDGGWNCRRHRTPKPHHSSFHTTFNVLDGLRQWLDVTPRHPLRRDVLAAEKSALTLMLEHHLFKSDKTGQVINDTFVMLSYPHRWHYDALRGLCYFARAHAPHDGRVQDAIDLLLSKRLADNTWPVQHKYSGHVFFEMESLGKPSCWNTLRALRVLTWWNGQSTDPAPRAES